MERKSQAEQIVDYHLQVYGRNLLAEKGKIQVKRTRRLNLAYMLEEVHGGLLHRTRHGMLVMCRSKLEQERSEIEIETCNRS